MLDDLRGDFFDAAGKLVDDDDTPESVVQLLEFVAEHIASRRTPWEIMFLLISGRLRRSLAKPSEKTIRLERDLAEMREPMRQLFHEAMASAALAIAFNSVIIGAVIRRVALYRVSKINRRNYKGGDDASDLMTGYTQRFA